MLDNIIINIILVLFPFLLYFVYNCYIGINNKPNYKKIVFEFTIIFSLYICIKFGQNTENNEILLFINMPILVAYLKKKDKLAVFTSILTLLYIYFAYSINIKIFYIMINFIGYFIIYTICRKKKSTNDNFIISIAIFQSFILSFLYYFNSNIKEYLLLKIIWMIIMFFLISIFILYMFQLLDNLSNIFVSVKDLEKEKQLKNSLFKLTHEIKNPLAVCKGYLQMMNLDNKEKTEKYLNIIKDEIERSLAIMADFKELNKITLTKDLVDINLLIEEVYNSLNLLTSSKNINIEFINKEEIYVNIDYNKIKQVLINIIKNSIEAIENNGIIKIDTHTNKTYLYIEITDNGIGMDKETIDKITELFFTTKQNGTGLGVALSNEIIKAHSGSIKYSSQLNIGTKVTIKLPLK